MSDLTPSLTSPGSPAGLMNVCRQFGLPVPALAAPDDANCRIWAPAKQPELHLAAGSCFGQDAAATRDAPLNYRLSTPLRCRGVARLEERFVEDLVYDMELAQSRQLLRQDEIMAHSGQGPETGTETNQTNTEQVNSLLADALLADTELAGLFAELRALLGDRDWLVCWGHDGTQAWLLGLFAWGWEWPQGDWISLPDLALPELISPLSQAVIQQAALDWLDTLTVRESESAAYAWVETLAGRLWLPAESARTLLGSIPGQPPPLSLSRLHRSLKMPEQIYALTETIWDTFVISHSRYLGNLQQWQEIWRLFLPSWHELGQLIRSLAAPLEARGTLAAFVAAHLSPHTRLQNRLQDLRELALQRQMRLQTSDPMARLTLKELMRQPEFRQSWQIFLGEYGHLGPGNLDLACPRFVDQAPQLLEILLQAWPERGGNPEMRGLHRLHRPLWRLLARLIDLRAALLLDTSWALQQLRLRLLNLATLQVEAGQLAQADDIWWLLPDELTQLDAGQQIPAALPQMRRQRQARWQAQWQHDYQTSNSGHSGSNPDTWTGQGLGNGMAQGQIWRPDQSFSPPPDTQQGIILLSERLDLGWLPWLARVSGVILTRSTPLDAEAMLLRELGIPGIVGLQEAHSLSNGQLLRLNADTGSVTALEG